MSPVPADPADTGSAAPGRRPGMVKVYVAGCVLVALALGGAWMWVAWSNWQFGAAEAARRQQAAAEQLGLPVEKTVDLGGGVALELVLIPAGHFDMGSPDDEAGRGSDEGPLHRVRIGRPFYMGRHEVTRAVWEKVTGSNPSYFKGPKLPVEQVSWDDCQGFLKKLNALVKGPGRFRLPTEAEWEWACRAGTRTRFCFGDADADLAAHAWYAANSGNTTHPAGGKQPNAWGLYDCHGNVWEWCSDWYGKYEANPWPGVFRWQSDPQGPAAGSGRVLRGGSWDVTPVVCRSALRDLGGPSGRDDDVGFRVVLPAAGP